jgi:hypothetical protein
MRQMCSPHTGGISVTLDATGSGANLLALTGADVDRLRATGATPTDIRARFGTPTATYRSEATRVLHFSRSPTSTHYHVRTVGLDQHGRVCWKRADIHWD